ncbi:MAG: hypothetical protein SVO01_00210 [Thermotogota bacterium]|nr:hypothetical protein [Thermotogota bacterium]
MSITKKQFAEWKTHPVTIEVYKEINQAVKTLKDNLSDGSTINYNAEATHGMTNRIVGQIEGLNQIINLSYEDEELPEDEG